METLQDKAKAIAKQLNKNDITRYDATDDALDLMHEYDYETGCIINMAEIYHYRSGNLWFDCIWDGNSYAGAGNRSL